MDLSSRTVMRPSTSLFRLSALTFLIPKSPTGLPLILPAEQASPGSRARASSHDPSGLRRPRSPSHTPAQRWMLGPPSRPTLASLACSNEIVLVVVFHPSKCGDVPLVFEGGAVALTRNRPGSLARRRPDGCHLSLIHISEPTRRTPISYA